MNRCATSGDRLSPCRGQWVIRSREGDPVDDDQLARRPRHVDALPQTQGPEQARRRVTCELPYQSGDLVFTLAQDLDGHPLTGEAVRAAPPGPPGRRIENSPSVRPPAASTRASSSSIASVGVPSRPGGGRWRPRHRRSPGAGSRTASRHRRRSTRAHPRRAAPSSGHRVGSQLSVAEVSTTVRSASTLSRTSIATLIGATRSTAPRRRLVGEPDDVELAALEDPLGVLEHLVDRGPRDLQRPVRLGPGLRLELTLHRPGDIPDPAQGQDERIGQAENPAASGIPSRTDPSRSPAPVASSDRSLRLPALRAAPLTMPTGQLVGDRQGGPARPTRAPRRPRADRVRATSGDLRTSRSP